MRKPIDNRLLELEKTRKESGALLAPTADPNHYTWSGHPGTWTLADVRKRVSGVILIFDVNIPEPAP